MKTYIIKLEDKAAFLNVCRSVGITFKTEDLKTDRINETFSLTIYDSEDQKNVDKLLKQHPNIDVLKRSRIKESHYSLVDLLK